MRKKITKKEIFLFLKQNKSATVSTVSFENTPEASTMYYGVDEHLTLYIAVGDKTRKYANLKRNPAIALVMTDEYMQQTVQAEGKAEEMHSVRNSSKAIKTLTEVLSPNIWQTIAHIWDPIPPIVKMNNGKIVIFKIKPTWMRWADFQVPVDKAGREFFQLLIP